MSGYKVSNLRPSVSKYLTSLNILTKNFKCVLYTGSASDLVLCQVLVTLTPPTKFPMLLNYLLNIPSQLAQAC